MNSQVQMIVHPKHILVGDLIEWGSLSPLRVKKIELLSKDLYRFTVVGVNDPDKNDSHIGVHATVKLLSI